MSCPGGRWGRRRVRVTECWYTLRAEVLYTELLESHPSCGPGLAGSADLTIAARKLSFGWELRPNAVWGRGRLFLTCARCRRHATRLYLPREDSWLACRRCWGLTYESRQHRNYKDRCTRLGALLGGVTMRQLAYLDAERAREERHEASSQPSCAATIATEAHRHGTSVEPR